MAETKRSLLERALTLLETILITVVKIEKELRASRKPTSLRVTFGTPETRTNLPQGTTMADVTLTDIQHTSGKIDALDGAGNPVPLDFPTPPTWTSSDPTIVTVSPSADGSNADIATTGKLGTAQITVAGTDAAGDQVTGIGNVTVVTSGAKTFSLTFGTPSNK